MCIALKVNSCCGNALTDRGRPNTRTTSPHTRLAVPPSLATHSMARGCTHKRVKAVMALHSLGSIPLRLLPHRLLQVGGARTSEGAMDALHDTTRGEAQPAQCPPSAELSQGVLSALVGSSLHFPLHVGCDVLL
jgi:hypothetical protein